MLTLKTAPGCLILIFIFLFIKCEASVCFAQTTTTPTPTSSPTSTSSEQATPAPSNTQLIDQNTNLFDSITTEVSKVFNQSKNAVVRVEAMDRFGVHAGTGFLVDPNGTIYTHYSLVGDSWNFTVEFEGKKYPATCLVADRHSGVAILKIEVSSTPFLPIGKSDNLTIASAVVAIGYPLDLPVSPNFGLISGFDQKVLGGFLLPTHIRANLAVQPGEQGAPLLNLQGEVVGIIVGRLLDGHVCFALPIKAVEKIHRDYTRFGKSRPGFIGVTIDSLPQNDTNSPDTPTHIAALDADTPAAKSGLEKDDIILKVGDTEIKHPSDILDASFYLTAGEDVNIIVSRGGIEKSFLVHAIDHPTYSRKENSATSHLNNDLTSSQNSSEDALSTLSIQSTKSVDRIEEMGSTSLLPIH